MNSEVIKRKLLYHTFCFVPTFGSVNESSLILLRAFFALSLSVLFIWSSNLLLTIGYYILFFFLIRLILEVLTLHFDWKDVQRFKSFCLWSCTLLMILVIKRYFCMTVILEIVIRTLDHSQTRMTYLTLRTRFHLRLERFSSWTCIRSEVNLSYSETRIDHVVDINLNFFPTFFVKLEFLRMLFCEAFVEPPLLSFLLKLYLVWLSRATACFVDRLLLKILFFCVFHESIFCFFNLIFVTPTCLKLFWFWDRLVS